MIKAEQISMFPPLQDGEDADVLQREAYQKNFEGIISNWALFNLNYYLEEKAQIILEAEEK